MLDESTAINGMFSFTPDMGSVVGESADVRGLLDLRGGLGHARRGHGEDGRRVDRGGRALDGHGRSRCEPLLPVHDDEAVRSCARRPAIPRGLRHPASAPADVAPARAEAHALLRASPGPGRGVLHRRRLGAAAVVRGEPRVDRRAVGVADRLGGAELVAVRRGGAHRHARARGDVRHHAVREVRHHGRRRALVPRAHQRQHDRPSRRDGRLHLDAHAVGRYPMRPHRDAEGRGPLPHRHRRRVRPARPRVAARPATTR